MSNVNVYETQKLRDLGLVAALVTRGHQFTSLERDPSGRVYFVFSSSKELVETIETYWSNTLLVPARAYSENVKMLKSRIYGGQ